MSTEAPEINWGYNCLTAGIHHGRPEALWNIPLLYAATTLYPAETLKELVISRIYNDALQFVEHNDKYDQAWADKVKELAEGEYRRVLQHKVDELSNYYKSVGFGLEGQETARRVTDQKLNPHYAPLHPHDSINLFCRILGTSAVMDVDQ